MHERIGWSVDFLARFHYVAMRQSAANKKREPGMKRDFIAEALNEEANRRDPEYRKRSGELWAYFADRDQWAATLGKTFLIIDQNEDGFSFIRVPVDCPSITTIEDHRPKA